MQQNIILTSSLLFGVLLYGLISKWYVIPALDRRSREDAIVLLALIHCFRYQGLSFLQPGVVSADLHRTFALSTAYGDLLTAVLATVSVVALRSRWKIAIPLVWVFNSVGSLDLLYALPQGLLHIHAGQLGGAYYIPTLVVPALIVSHVLIFRILLKRGKSRG